MRHIGPLANTSVMRNLDIYHESCGWFYRMISASGSPPNGHRNYGWTIAHNELLGMCADHAFQIEKVKRVFYGLPESVLTNSDDNLTTL